MKRYLVGVALIAFGAAGTAARAEKVKPPIYINGRPAALGLVDEIGLTWVPLRFVGESLGATVQYDAFSHVINITQSNVQPALPTPKYVSGDDCLKGLSGQPMAVSVERLRESEQTDGLSQSALESEVTEGLKDKRLNVTGERFSDPTLHVCVTCVKNDQIPIYSYSIDVSLYRNVTFGAFTSSVNVWEKSYTGLVGAKLLAPTVKTTLSTMVDSFASSYERVN